jgi:hypothetical protein
MRQILLATFTLLFLAAGCSHRPAPGVLPTEPTVELRCSRINGAGGIVKVHEWFATFEPGHGSDAIVDPNWKDHATRIERGRWHRWEIGSDATWSADDESPYVSAWGIISIDGDDPSATTYRSSDYATDSRWPLAVVDSWRGAKAERIIAALKRAPLARYRSTFRPWPGANGNTWITWILRSARVGTLHHPLAVGKDYRGWVGAGLSSSRTGIAIDTIVLGCALGLRDGFELHIAGSTLGVNFWPPALVTPIGRLGF